MLLNRSPLFKLLRQAYFKVWWVDVLYPLLLSFLLFWSLSYLLYSGQKHRRVSSQIETRMIYWSLWSAGPRLLQKPSPFLTISLVEEDFHTLNQVNIHEHRDTSLINYAFLLDKLLDLGTKTVFIHWQADAFPYGSHYEPLYTLIEKSKRLNSQIFFVIHPTLMMNLPARSERRRASSKPIPAIRLCRFCALWARVGTPG